MARMALLLAGLPVTVPGETVNRLCASGMSAVANAARARAARRGRLLRRRRRREHDARAVRRCRRDAKPFARDIELFDTSLGWRFVNPKMKAKYGTDSMGETAENVAEQYQACRARTRTRSRCARSRRRRRRGRPGASSARSCRSRFAQKKGDPKRVRRRTNSFARTRRSTMLAKLKPAFRDRRGGSVTAGNSSGLNDGAAALLVASRRRRCKSSARRRSRASSRAAVAGVEPRIMGMGPVPASRKALERAGLTLDQMDVIELNEAFAAQSLACLRELGIADDDPRVNPNGGAIALGHPLGMSGARLLLTAARELAKSGGRYALCTMCIGVGQGMATMLESVTRDLRIRRLSSRHPRIGVRPPAGGGDRQRDHRPRRVRRSGRGDSRRLGRRRDRRRVQRAGELRHPHVPRRDRRARAERPHWPRRGRAWRADWSQRAHRDERRDHGQCDGGRRMRRRRADVRAVGHADPGAQGRRRQPGEDREGRDRRDARLEDRRHAPVSGAAGTPV